VLTLILATAAAGVTSLLVTPLVMRFALARNLLDVPGDRRVHVAAVPSLGGVAVFSGLLGGLLVFWGTAPGSTFSPEEGRFVFGLLAGGACLFLAGVVDDVVGLRPAAKVGVQILAALAVYHFGFRIEVLAFGTDMSVSLGWLGLPLTVFWIVGVTNAFNLIDGLDGLATGIALVALATITLVGGMLGSSPVVVAAACLAGALLGFVRYNVNPAKIFLGDSGSLFIGFMLAVVSVQGARRGDGAVLALVPLFALALPLLDTSLAVARRWLRGTPISAPDRRHVHHRLLAVGLNQRQAVLVMWSASLSLAFLGVCLAFAPPPMAVWVGVAGGGGVLLLLLVALRSLRYHEFEETGSALVSALRKGRRAVRDRIQARDTAEWISTASDLTEINTTLASNASRFEFLHMEICPESAGGRRGENLRVGAWKLDYPVTNGLGGHDPLVLRIWCRREGSFRPYGAERVARIIGPPLEEWLRDRPLIAILDLGQPPPAPPPLDPVEPRVLRSI